VERRRLRDLLQHPRCAGAAADEAVGPEDAAKGERRIRLVAPAAQEEQASSDLCDVLRERLGPLSILRGERAGCRPVLQVEHAYRRTGADGRAQDSAGLVPEHAAEL